MLSVDDLADTIASTGNNTTALVMNPYSMMDWQHTLDARYYTKLKPKYHFKSHDPHLTTAMREELGGASWAQAGPDPSELRLSEAETAAVFVATSRTGICSGDDELLLADAADEEAAAARLAASTERIARNRSGGGAPLATAAAAASSPGGNVHALLEKRRSETRRIVRSLSPAQSAMWRQLRVRRLFLRDSLPGAGVVRMRKRPGAGVSLNVYIRVRQARHVPLRPRIDVPECGTVQAAAGAAPRRKKEGVGSTPQSVIAKVGFNGHKLPTELAGDAMFSGGSQRGLPRGGELCKSVQAVVGVAIRTQAAAVPARGAQAGRARTAARRMGG